MYFLLFFVVFVFNLTMAQEEEIRVREADGRLL